MTRIKKLFIFFSIVFCGLCFVCAAYAVPLTGYVKSKTGTPLSGVEVLTYAPLIETNPSANIPPGTQKYSVKTDADGFFSLPNHGQLIYFRNQSLRPLSKAIELKAKELTVNMEDAAESLWKVPLCSSISDKSKREGQLFKLLLPENIILKKQADLDGEIYFFGLPLGRQTEVMVNWTDAPSMEPDEKFVLASREFSERTWKSGDITGYEIRGIKSDGKWWRRVSFKGGTIAYQGNSQEAAKIFDSLIDNMCLEK